MQPSQEEAVPARNLEMQNAVCKLHYTSCTASLDPCALPKRALVGLLLPQPSNKQEDPSWSCQIPSRCGMSLPIRPTLLSRVELRATCGSGAVKSSVSLPAAACARGNVLQSSLPQPSESTLLPW